MDEIYPVLRLLCTRSLRALYRFPKPRKGERIPKKYRPRKELLERLSMQTGFTLTEVETLLKAERRRILQTYGLTGKKLDM